MLVLLQILLEKKIEMDGQAFVVFIYYRKTFDSIIHVQMFEILSDMGFPKHLVALLEAFTMARQLSLDGTIATVVLSRL